jgi:hypothetical protein
VHHNRRGGADFGVYRTTEAMARNLRAEFSCMKRLTLLALAFALGCGDAPAPELGRSQAAAGAADTVEIQGTVAPGGPALEKLLVFGYVNGTRPGGEAASLSAVGPDRSFALTNIPPGDATVLFLIDAKNDGVIDPGDSVAALEDPQHQLRGLKSGDSVFLPDVVINAATAKATAAITVKQGEAPAATATAP